MSTSTSLGVGAAPMGPSGIVMDTSKAMATLGFSPSQTFESTSMSEIISKLDVLQSLIMNLPP